MKKLLPITLAALALLTATSVRAWNYTDGDTLLIFRLDNFNTVEYDLGNISQFTNVPSGTTINVTNWNKTVATGVYGSDLTGVGVSVVSTTSWTNAVGNKFSWVSAADTNATVNNFTPSGWQSKLSLIIGGVGQGPLTYLTPSNQPAAYSIDPGVNSIYRKSTYDYIVSGGNYGSIPQLGGNTPFTVETTIPGNFSLWRIAPDGLGTAAAYVGTFSISAAGALTFKAGALAAPAPAIQSITRSGAGVNSVTFTTTSGFNYSLAYTNVLRGAASTWPVVNGPIAGDGNSKTLAHTTTDDAGYYRVVRSP